VSPGLARNRTLVAAWNGSFENNLIMPNLTIQSPAAFYSQSDFLVSLSLQGDSSQ